MASTNMKAVVTLTADASGVATGVNRALGQLQRLQDGVMQLRSLAVAGMLANVFGKFASGAMDQANQIMDAARTYSPEGMRGAMQKDLAETESMMELGKAFGNIVGLIDQAAAAHIKDLTQHLIDNKEPIGQALAAIVGFGMGIADVSAELLIAFGKLIEWVDTLMSAPMTAVDQVGNAASSGQLGIQVQGAGMIYELLRRKIGGD